MPYIYTIIIWIKAIAGEIFSEPPVTRIVLELQPGVAYSTYQSEDKKSVILTFENIVEDITIENNKDEFIVNLKTTNPSQMEYFPDRPGQIGFGY